MPRTSPRRTPGRGSGPFVLFAHLSLNAAKVASHFHEGLLLAQTGHELPTAPCGEICTSRHHGYTKSYSIDLRTKRFQKPVGHLSGAHINPAVTVAFALTCHFPWSLVPAYVLSQLLGACAASAVHLALLGDTANLGATVPSDSPCRWPSWSWF